MPRGLFQVATGDGATGAALVAHPGVDHVTFVGSADTGARVAEACARRLVPVELELGGKSPNLVFADADTDKALPAIVNGLLQNAGQSCSAGSRLLGSLTPGSSANWARCLSWMAAQLAPPMPVELA